MTIDGEDLGPTHLRNLSTELLATSTPLAIDPTNTTYNSANNENTSTEIPYEISTVKSNQVLTSTEAILTNKASLVKLKDKLNDTTANNDTIYIKNATNITNNTMIWSLEILSNITKSTENMTTTMHEPIETTSFEQEDLKTEEVVLQL